jgi:DNA-binding response OmpR family regulator
MPDLRLSVVDDNAALGIGLTVDIRANFYPVLFAEHSISAAATMVTAALVILSLGLRAGGGFDVMRDCCGRDRLAEFPAIVSTDCNLSLNRSKLHKRGPQPFSKSRRKITL